MTQIELESLANRIRLKVFGYKSVCIMCLSIFILSCSVNTDKQTKLINDYYSSLTSDNPELALRFVDDQFLSESNSEIIINELKEIQTCGGVKGLSISWSRQEMGSIDADVIVEFNNSCPIKKESIYLVSREDGWKITPGKGSRIKKPQISDTSSRTIEPRTYKKYNAIRSGDLIFQRSDDLISRLILALRPNSSYSHVGIISKEPRGDFVIDAVPTDGVRKIPLVEFLGEGSRSTVYRIRDVDKQLGKVIIINANEHLGKPFDNKFLMSDDHSLYCTELVIKSIHISKLSHENILMATTFSSFDEPIFLPDTLIKSQQLTLILKDFQP